MLFNNTNMRTAMAYTNAVGDKVYPIIVDIKKGIKSTEEVSFVSSDINTGVLSVAFIQGNDTYNVEGAEVICSIMRPDTTTLEIPCNTVNGNTIEVPLGVNGTSQDGVYSFDFKVFKGGNKIVGTPIMNYSVSLSISNDLVVEEDDRLPVLTMLMTQVNELKEETRETINQANVATEASREATANAIEATNNANAVSERVSQETATAISEIKQDTENAIASVNQSTNDAIASMTQKTDEAVTMINDSLANVTNVVTTKVAELDNAKSDMANTVSNKVNEVENRFNALTSSQQQSSEVIDARDGETSLKARLDRDTEKAKQVYVNVEGSNISTDSSSGYAKDVEILGNTIQDASNLADIRSVGDKVEGQELYEIPVLCSGKNLFDGLWESGTIDQNTGSLNIDLNTIRSLNYIEVSPNTNYIASSSVLTKGVVWHSYDENYKFIEGVANKGLTYYTTPNNAKYIKIRTFLGDNNVISLTCPLQIEESTQATPYEPYQEDKLTILSPVQLEKVGDVADRIICKDGVWGVEKNIIDVMLNTNISWNRDNFHSTNYNSFWVSNIYNNLIGFGSNRDLISCISPHIQGVTRSTYEVCDFSCISLNANGTGVTIKVPNTITTSDELNVYLASMNMNLKVGTNKPQFIPLPHDQQVKLRTFAGQTNIHFETEIEGTIKAQVPKSIGATVNTHTEQIRSLNNELNRVKKLEESTVSTVTTESDFTTVEATSNGYFEDVKLEGKTLVNLLHDWKVKRGTLPTITNGSFTNDFVSNNTILYCEINTNKATLSCDVATDDGNGVVFSFVSSIDDIGVTFLSKIIVNNNFMKLIDIPQGAKYITIQRINSTTGVATVKNLMLLEGDHTQNPPSYFEGLKSVGQSATTSEDGVDELVVSSVNENLWLPIVDDRYSNAGLNCSAKYIGGVISVTGKGTGSGEACSDYRFINVKLKPNTTYTFSYDSDTDYGTTVGTDTVEVLIRDMKTLEWLQHKIPKTGAIFTTKSSGLIGVRFDVNKDNATHSFYNIQIKEGNSIDLYTPHQSDKKPLLYYNNETQTWEKPILREWDSIEKHSDGKYYYHQRSGEVVLNGSENWACESPTANTIYGICVINNVKNFSEIRCDKFKGYNYSIYVDDIEGIYTAENRVKLKISKSKLSTQDVQGFKQWLQANNVTVVYQLAQEKIYECTNIDLITYNGETNYVVNSGAIAPRTTLKVHNNISNVVRILQEKVSLLENKFIEGLKKVLAGDMYSLAELLYPEDFVEENPENDIMLLSCK